MFLGRRLLLPNSPTLRFRIRWNLYLFVTLFSETSQNRRKKVGWHNKKVGTGSIFQLALSFLVYLHFWPRYGLTLKFSNHTTYHTKLSIFFLFIMLVKISYQDQSIQTHACWDYFHGKLVKFLGVFYSSFHFQCHVFEVWPLKCLQITIGMTASCFLNLAAIFSLDLESQSTSPLPRGSIENYVIRGKWGGGLAAAREFILKVSPIIKLSESIRRS